MTIKSHKNIFFFLIFSLTSFLCKAQFINGLRIGGGAGESIYWGSQMDDKMSFSTYKRSEFNPGYNFQIYKSIDSKSEIGFRYLNTQLWSFKGGNTQAINAKINEFSIIYQRSLNDNIHLKSNRIKFTHNLLAGLGLIYFKSKYFIIDSKSGYFAPYSSVGYGSIPVISNLVVPEQQAAVGIVLGYNIGYRLAPNFTLYFENTFTLSTSNEIHGNLASKSKVTNNGYTYHALSLYLNISARVNPLGCPKF